MLTNSYLAVPGASFNRFYLGSIQFTYIFHSGPMFSEMPSVVTLPPNTIKQSANRCPNRFCSNQIASVHPRTQQWYRRP
ncbi:hypothetical protein BST61_g8138 [Cercospora zeina]